MSNFENLCLAKVPKFFCHMYYVYNNFYDNNNEVKNFQFYW